MEFVLWLFISNLIQILLMPVIMVGKPLQGRHADLLAEEDFAVNQKAEGEIEAIMWQLQTATSRRLESRGASHRP